METIRTKTPIWFWFISIPLLILGIMGILQINSIWASEITEPLWAKLCYSGGIIGILIGSIFLVFRKKSASFFFIASLIGFLIHRAWVFGFSERAEEAPWTLFLPVIIILISILIVKLGSKKKWIT